MSNGENALGPGRTGFYDGSELAFLIEEAQDEWTEDSKWKTRERAAAEAVLARFWLEMKPKTLKVGDIVNSEEKLRWLPDRAIIALPNETFLVTNINGNRVVIRISDNEMCYLIPCFDYKVVWLPSEVS